MENELNTSKPPSIIKFPNSNTARLICVSKKDLPDDFLERLGLPQPKALILFAGGTKGFDAHLKSRMYQFCREIDRAAFGIGAVIIDSGVCDEGIAILDDKVIYRRYRGRILGISPVNRLTYPGMTESDFDPDKANIDPDHSHFILVDTSDQNSDIDMMFSFVEFLKKPINIPEIIVLVNGGKPARTQVLRGVRMGSPLIIFKGSGGLADEIAELHENPLDFIEDTELDEIVKEGKIHLFPMESSINALEPLILREMRMDNVLKQAWRQFGVYDLNAIRHQYTFQNIQNAIIWLVVLGTALALIQTSIDEQTILNKILHYAIIIVPIITSILLAAANEFKSGNKWILLRGSAELLKSQIFLYRTKAETSIFRQRQDETREYELAEKLEQISTQLMQTEVNLSALKPYNGPLPPEYGTKPGDDGFSMLSPEKYLHTRLEDQLNFYVSKTAKLEKRLHRLGWLVYIVGGLGTMLAAFGMELWVALTGSMAAAFGTHIKYEMLQENLTKYNQAAVSLSNVRNWWISLSASEQAQKSNINLLVENTEGILRSEFSSWVQEMQDAIASMQKEEKENREAEHNRSKDT